MCSDQTLIRLSPQALLDKAEAGELTVRDMHSRDLQQVVQIEANAQISPWGRLSFEESLTKRHVCRVVLVAKVLVAYHVVCPAADELHILNVVAAPHLQGLGLGHCLMQDIIDVAENKSLRKVFLEVRASNKTAQSLYLKWKFKQIALRKHYYRASSSGTREDALVFLRELKK